MANKTTETQDSVTHFVNTIEDTAKRSDAFELIKLMQLQTGYEPRMWGSSIIGFGSYHYKYDSGHEGDAPLVGFSPRKAAISLYLYPSFEDKEALLTKLGKHKTGKGCIYIKKITDIDVEVLKTMITASVAYLLKKYTTN